MVFVVVVVIVSALGRQGCLLLVLSCLSLSWSLPPHQRNHYGTKRCGRPCGTALDFYRHINAHDARPRLQAAAAALVCGTGDGEDSEDDSEVDGEYVPGEGDDDDDDGDDDDDDMEDDDEDDNGEEEENVMEEVRGMG